MINDNVRTLINLLESGELILAEKKELSPITGISDLQSKIYVDSLKNTFTSKDVFHKITPVITRDTPDKPYFNYTKTGAVTRVKDVDNFVLSTDGLYLSIFLKSGEFIEKAITYSSYDKDGLSYGINDFSVNDDRTLLAIAQRHSHVVDIYNIAVTDTSFIINERVGRFGEWRLGGDVKDGKLITPYRIEWMTNNDFVLYSVNHAYEDNVKISSYPYTVSLFKYENKEITHTKVLLTQKSSGSLTKDGECSKLTSMKRSNNKLILVTTGDIVGIYDFVDGELMLECIIPVPVDIDVDRLSVSSAVLKDDETLYVSISAVDMVVILNMINGVWTPVKLLGESVYDNTKTPKLPYNGFWDIKDLCMVDGEMLVADGGNSRLSRLSEKGNVELRYDLPPGEILYSDLDIDENGLLLQKLNEPIRDINVLIREGK